MTRSKAISPVRLASSETQARPAQRPFVLPEAVRLELYRLMALSRRIDDMEIQLKRQNLAYFQISAAGHEASLAAATCHLRPGHDWFFPYYRDRTLCLGLGVSPVALLQQTVGAAADPASGGRQMPSHWSAPELHIVSEASTTGTQYLTAVGCAEAGQSHARRGDKAAFEQDEVVYCSSGEGTTSQGYFFEALNQACLDKLPVIFHVEDNGYAISVPVEQQTAGGSITALTAGYPGLLRIEFDGCDPEASFTAWGEGVAYARARKGPVLMHAHVVRPYSHSLSDDETHYRSQEEVDAQTARDPVPTYRTLLGQELEDGESKLADIDASIEAEVQAAAEEALASPAPGGKTAERFIFSETVDPTGPAFDTPMARVGSDDKTVVDLINACMRDEMAHNDRIVVFGEDVADASREAILSECRGKGGVFKVTYGLQRRYGSARVFNSPLSESNIVGRAVGMALRGIKPVVEIQFFDYIWPAFMHMRSEMALMRWRSNNGWACPMVIRAAYGGYLKGGAVFHSQTGESIFTHLPGLRVVLPSTAEDANGLLRTAIRCDDPVLFLEHKHLYRQTYNKGAYPGPEYMIPFGKAAKVRSGVHLTLITYGATVKRSLDAAQQAAQAGVEVELLDLRTLSPYDWEAIAESVEKTGKALLVHEESRSWGFGAEIAARLADEMFSYLDAPVRRVAAKDCFVGYHPNLEDATLPQTADIHQAIVDLAAY